MLDSDSLRVPKWPFFLGDAAMLGLAYFIYFESRLPLGHWEMIACGVCVALGAMLGVFPFVLDHRARIRQLDAQALGHVGEKIQNLEHLAAQISGATNEWENVQLQAEKTSTTAKEISDRMAAEVREFTEFMQKANDGEKATLRLEVEKLRRAEGDWLQVLVHLLDHVHALHTGATRSGQPRLIEQLTNFQNACRDTARRVGLVPFAAAARETFDAKRHQLVNGEEMPANGAVIGETLATGFTFQGRLVRPALVRVGAPAQAAPAAAGQNQLALEPSSSS